MKKILSILSLICVLTIFFPNQTHAFSFYSSRENISKDNVLWSISSQSYNSSMTLDDAKSFISHFIDNTSSYNKVPNSGSMRSVGTDGTYTTNIGWSSKGCYHYADFIAVTMYGTKGERRYIDEPVGSITPNGLKTFLDNYGQVGEHLRVHNRHSLSFVASTDAGFYTLQYYGENTDPFLSFSTYEYFAELLNSIGRDFFIFDSDTAVNSMDTEPIVEVHKTGWVKEDGQWFFINPDGEVATGWLRNGGRWYYLDNRGVMETGWIRDGGKWYYLLSSGAMGTGWTKVNNKWYYMSSSGVMETGWLYNSGKWYYLNSSGAMETGWVGDGGRWYYLFSSGVMQTGWTKANNKWYYMSGTGAMQTGWVEDNGKRYFLNEDGSWLVNPVMKQNVFGASDKRALVNKSHSIGQYRPSDLVRVNVPTVKQNSDENLMRREAANKLKEMFDSAKQSCLTLYARSGFRSYFTQNQLFQNYAASHGVTAANRFSARPGHSEHQTGLAMDISSANVNYQLTERFGQTPEGIWVGDNAHRFGFIIRYPKGKETVTGYIYEPWHIRYIGVWMATEVYKSGLTYEEFLKDVGYNI